MQNLRCDNCIHYLGGLKCQAFDLIPDQIILNNNDHSEKIDGQNGDFVFEDWKDLEEKTAETSTD